MRRIKRGNILLLEYSQVDMVLIVEFQSNINKMNGSKLFYFTINN